MTTLDTGNPRRIDLSSRGARGESFADIARRTGLYGVVPTDTDAEALSKLNAAAELSAAMAEALVGPNYPDTTAGLAATSDTESFAVDNGDGTVTIYLNDGGSAVAQRTLATTAALAANDGAESVGSDDSAAGSLWTTIAGFITYLRSSLGAGVIGTTTDSLQNVLDGISTALGLRYLKTEVDAIISRFTYVDGPRTALTYSSPTQVAVYNKYAQMAEFRFRGNYTASKNAPVFPMPADNRVTYSTTGCPELSAVKLNTWVAGFAVANEADPTATLRTMPFLRVGAPSGSTLPIIEGGENVTDFVTTASHSWAATDNLAGAKCLIISEGLAWSGKVTTVTANTSTSITLEDAHSLVAGDFILVAPPGVDYFVYLGSFYFDGAEVRNIYDSGTIVKGKMVTNNTTNIAAGGFASPTEINFKGNISPLATAVILDSIATISSASLSDIAEYFAGDGSNHTVQTKYVRKSGTSNLTYVFDNVQVPFLYHQTIHYSNAGSLIAQRISGQLETTGWIEP